MKLRDKIHTGREMPGYLQVAWGRHVFRLCHGGRDCGLWLRDLPLNLHDLKREYGFDGALRAYREECARVGIPGVQPWNDGYAAVVVS